MNKDKIINIFKIVVIIEIILISALCVYLLTGYQVKNNPTYTINGMNISKSDLDFLYSKSPDLPLKFCKISTNECFQITKIK